MAATTDSKTTPQTGTDTGRQIVTGAPVKLLRPETTLQDKYLLEQGTIFLSGVQALVRVLLDQHRADVRAGLDTGTFVSGYQGSPLGGFDKEVMRLGDVATEHGIEFRTGLNEELAATAVYGSQLVNNLPGARKDGVLGVWYGKNPGLDRAMDALRHANFAGTNPNGGALALVGDDPSCKSSTLPSGAEATLAALNVPTFYPGNLQEVLDLGLHAIACSRASGLWSALKIVTNVADAAGTAQVWPDRVTPVLPSVEYEGRPYRHQPSGHLLAPQSIELERTLFGPRLELARRYGALNQLNPISLPTRDAWLGIVAAGKTYYELIQALRELGLDQRDLEHAGVRLMKVGMLYPHDRDGFRAFGHGLSEILVVEEKLPHLETALRDALYGTADAPRILGKRDDQGRPLVPAESELDADTIALAVAARIEQRGQIASVHARAHQIAERREALQARPGALPILARTPFFCSGCPHNTSTKNDDATLVGAGIGCHTMILLSPEGKGEITGITQMGGEGAQFVGMAPFTDSKHFVQNIGDGTFHHSGSLAIRFAIASKVNVTYKLLYNSTVAMTGGQDILGQLTVPEMTRWMALEGVKRIIVTTEEPERYRGVALDPIARVVHRDKLADAQAELAKIEGVTVLIHDQECAAERRRLRKRGKAPTPPQRVAINERVCEGCGDCGQKSACLSVIPVDTEFGRKTQIHQASCNQDFSCLKGDCPSFLEIIPAAKKRAKAFPAPPADLPEPVLRVPRDDYLVRMPGVGGTGVVTVSQILQMAALLDGKHAFGLDQTGLAQKGGPVISDVRIARERIEGSNKASVGRADLLLGLDVLGTASPKNLLVADSDKTVAVVSTTATPTATMVLDPAVSFPAQRSNLRAIERNTRARENVYLDAQALSEALFGDHMPTNLLLLGAAFQHGCVPLSADAIEQAIHLNGAAVDKSLAAFRWGRAAVARPELVDELLAPVVPEHELSAKARAIVDATGAEGELRRLLEIRVEDLIGYQSARYARRYAEDVMEMAARHPDLAEAYARGLHKLMAYKDEYEVARLHLDSVEKAKLTAEFGEGAKVRFLLHPPLLRALGVQRKIKLGRWFVPAFRLLRAGRRLRGTPLDLFGLPKVRRVERALVDEYRELVRAVPTVEAAELADVVRGYEDIKLRNVERFRARAAEMRGVSTSER